MTASTTPDKDNTAGGGPKGPITDRLTKPLPKRFYKDAAAADLPGGGYGIGLDGRILKTPAKATLAVPTRALADAIAGEWRAQGAEIDPATMPLTRFANTAVDAVANAEDAVRDDVVAYAGRDLLCYRADAPAALVVRQAAEWNPVLAWFEQNHAAKFAVVGGVMPVDQTPETLAKIAAALKDTHAFQLTPLHVMTTLTGSALLALAHVGGVMDAGTAWRMAHVDEDFQIAQWGEDEEATSRRAGREAEFQAASRFYALVSGD